MPCLRVIALTLRFLGEGEGEEEWEKINQWDNGGIVRQHIEQIQMTIHFH